MVRYVTILHRVVALAITVGAPLAAYIINGTLEPWTFALGAVMGFSYWYFLTPIP